MNAAKDLMSSANASAGLLANLDKQSFDNRTAGVGLSNAALAAQNYAPTTLLSLEQMRRSIPADELKRIASILLPLAGLGGTQTATEMGTQDMSDVDAFNKIASGLGNLFKLGSSNKA